MSISPADRFVSAKELAGVLGVCTKTVYRWSRDGVLPKPRKLGKRASRWFWPEVEEFLERCPTRFRRRA